MSEPITARQFQPHPDVTVTGFADCRPMFGL